HRVHDRRIRAVGRVRISVAHPIALDFRIVLYVEHDQRADRVERREDEVQRERHGEQEASELARERECPKDPSDHQEGREESDGDEPQEHLLELDDHHYLDCPVEYHLLDLVRYREEAPPRCESEETGFLEHEFYVYRELRNHRGLDIAQVGVVRELLAFIEQLLHEPYAETHMAVVHIVIDGFRVGRDIGAADIRVDILLGVQYGSGRQGDRAHIRREHIGARQGGASGPDQGCLDHLVYERNTGDDQ